MKFSTAFLLAAPAMGFTPAAPASRPTALKMSTEAATEKVRFVLDFYSFDKKPQSAFN